VANSRRAAPALPDAHVDTTRVMAFVNTLSGRETAAPTERLTSYQALVDWARGEGVVPGAAADRLLAEARQHPRAADEALERARELRETLHALFFAVDQRLAPSLAVLSTLAAHIGSAYAQARLVPHEGALQWAPGPASSLDHVGAEMARGAGRLVTSNELARVRACAAQDCRWWFVDETKNRSRRWCDMKICGNREKLRRFRAKGALSSKGTRG
jgi:predicted RNA-binding Zn ribbon-like protein